MNTLTSSIAAVAPGAPVSGAQDASVAQAERDARIARHQASLSHSIGTYRYSKAKPNVVMCPAADGFKTLAAMLAEGAGGTWTHRARGYLMSARQLQKFNQSMADALAVQIA